MLGFDVFQVCGECMKCHPSVLKIGNSGEGRKLFSLSVALFVFTAIFVPGMPASMKETPARIPGDFAVYFPPGLLHGLFHFLLNLQSNFS
jgi:hypothetical protein